MQLGSEPWRALPFELASVIEPELEATTEEILAAIGREVPEYARPLEGSFGRGIRTGVAEALSQFAALIREPDAERAQGRDVYRALGRGELRQGRTLDSLQAAYRVGARVAWRRLAVVAQRAHLDAQTLSLLAESIFAYIDQLAAASVEGYAEAMAEREDEQSRRRRALAALLVRHPAPSRVEAEAAAAAIGWAMPQEAAALACEEADLARLRRRLDPAALVGGVLDGAGCILVPDPIGPGRGEELRRAGAETNATVGPAASPPDLHASWTLARAALAARRTGRLEAEGILLAEDHLGELLLQQGGDVVDAISLRRLGGLSGLTARGRERVVETALAYVQHGGNAAAMARALHVHPQTVRHRLGRLREVLGDQLDDPSARFELEAALRAYEDTGPTRPRRAGASDVMGATG